jgi:hypothetical protein
MNLIPFTRKFPEVYKDLVIIYSRNRETTQNTIKYNTKLTPFKFSISFNKNVLNTRLIKSLKQL